MHEVYRGSIIEAKRVQMEDGGIGRSNFGFRLWFEECPPKSYAIVDGMAREPPRRLIYWVKSHVLGRHMSPMKLHASLPKNLGQNIDFTWLLG